MGSILRGRRLLAAVALAAAVLVAVPLAASALSTLRSGNLNVQTVAATNDIATVSASTLWNDVPGAALRVSVPAGRRALVTTSFNAESACYGVSGYCSTRTVVVLPTGALVELSPAGGADFAFDSTDLGRESAASWEAHSAERNTYLPAGSWLLKVQRRVTSPSISFRLDEIHLKAEVALI